MSFAALYGLRLRRHPLAIWKWPHQRIAVVAVGIFLSGCAHQKYWAKPGATEQDFEIDKGRCIGQSLQSAPQQMVGVLISTEI
jgi:hypothetical protein